MADIHDDFDGETDLHDAFDAEPVVAKPYKSPDDKPTTGFEALTGRMADKIPFSRQLYALIDAAKMKADGSPMDFGENYKQLLGAVDRRLDRSKREHPALSNLGSVAGFASSAAGMPGGGGWKSLAGLGAALGLSDATANPDSTLGDVAKQTLASAAAAPALGAVAGWAAPKLGALVGPTVEKLGSKAEDLAAWLKVHSLHPTPTLAETMADLPGGEVGVGRELLERGLGGMTKKGTATQVSAAKNEAASAISGVAKEYDAAGGAPIDLGPALDKAQTFAADLAKSPLHEEAANKLGNVLSKYDAIYRAKPATAEEALALKRELSEVAYSHAKAAANGDTVAGKYGEGLSKFERAVDDAMDASIGDKFGDANLTFRRLLKADDAATRSAGRTQGNAHLLGGLVPAVVGGGVMAAGHSGPEAVALGLGSSLLQKYGSQAGARALYSPVAGSLGMLGRGLQRFPSTLAGRAAAEESVPLSAQISALLTPPNQIPAVAGRGRDQQQTLAQLSEAK